MLKLLDLMYFFVEISRFAYNFWLLFSLLEKVLRLHFWILNFLSQVNLLVSINKTCKSAISYSLEAPSQKNIFYSCLYDSIICTFFLVCVKNDYMGIKNNQDGLQLDQVVFQMTMLGSEMARLGSQLTKIGSQNR